MFLKLHFAVSLSDLFITIQYAVFRKSLRTSYVSLCIYNTAVLIIFCFIYFVFIIYVYIYIYI